MKTVSDPKTASARHGAAARHAVHVAPWQVGPVVFAGTYTELCSARPRHGRQPDQADYLMKRMRPAYAEDPLAVSLLRREADVAAQVHHPHVIAVLDAQLDRPPYYLILPRLSGRSLAGVLTAGRTVAVPHALWLARQVAQGLQALHQAGWIHADIKPANIVVSPDGHATLIDLGCALGLAESAAAWDRPVAGTAAYLAPEMATTGYPVDARSDIYSLGVTLYEMLSGSLPFAPSHVSDQVAAHRQGTPRDLRQLVPSVPAEVAVLVRRMLAKQPLRRPQSAAELVETLVLLEIETLALRAATWTSPARVEPMDGRLAQPAS